MHASTLRRPVAVASALLLAATLAAAGSSRAAGPHGHSGAPHAAGGFVEHVLAGLKDRLALDSSQLQMFETARAGTHGRARPGHRAAQGRPRAHRRRAREGRAGPGGGRRAVRGRRASRAGRPGARCATSGSSSTRTCGPTRRSSSATRSAGGSPRWTACATGCTSAATRRVLTSLCSTTPAGVVPAGVALAARPCGCALGRPSGRAASR